MSSVYFEKEREKGEGKGSEIVPKVIELKISHKIYIGKFNNITELIPKDIALFDIQRQRINSIADRRERRREIIILDKCEYFVNI